MVSGLAVNVLGPVEVRRAGALLTVEGLKRRQLLAVLVAARGSEVSVERLGEALWEGGSPESARASLQSHVSRLRRALAPDQVVRAGGVGYAIDMSLVDLDADRFEELANDATGPERVPPLERALGLWRGAAFGEFAELPGVRGEALRLEELRLTVTERLIERPDGRRRGRSDGRRARSARRRPSAPRAVLETVDAGPLSHRPTGRGLAPVRGPPQPCSGTSWA